MNDGSLGERGLDGAEQSRAGCGGALPVLDGGASSRSLSLRDVIANTKYLLPIKTTQPFTPLSFLPCSISSGEARRIRLNIARVKARHAAHRCREGGLRLEPSVLQGLLR